MCGYVKGIWVDFDDCVKLFIYFFDVGEVSVDEVDIGEGVCIKVVV